MIDQNEIIKLENQYWDAMKANDIEEAMKLTKFPCIISGQTGTRKVSEADFKQMFQKMDGQKYAGVEIKDPSVYTLSEDTALISYEFDMNGKTMLDVSTWIRENNSWVCAFHSETEKNIN